MPASRGRLSLPLVLLAIVLAAQYRLSGAEDVEDPQGEVNLEKNTAYNNALKCLKNQTVACPSGTSLNQSGLLPISSGGKAQYCGGGCANQTLVQLTCMSNVIADFRFNNDATISDLKLAISTGCSTGNFTVKASANTASTMNLFRGGFWLRLTIFGSCLPFLYTRM